MLKGRTLYSAVTDGDGRFYFDSVVPGRYATSVQHDLLDSLGLHGLASTIDVATNIDTLRVSIPSFATLWLAACGARRVPADNGFVYGTVRDSKLLHAISGADVGVRWLDVSFDPKTGLSQIRMGGTVQSDAAGAYVICGVPSGTGMLLQATRNAASTAFIDLTMGPLRMQRRDLMLGTADSTGASRFGLVVGEVHGMNGQAVADARVSTEGVAETRSDSRGRFVLRDVPVGTRQLDVTSIGALPASRTVDVVTNDTAKVMLTLLRVTELEAVHVTALAVRERRKLDFEEHRKLGVGRFLDSTTIEKRTTIVGALLEAPQLKVNKAGQFVFISGHNKDCHPVIWIDRQMVQQEELNFLNLKAIAAMEIYPRKPMVPSEFWGSGGMPGCAIVVWTKLYFQ